SAQSVTDAVSQPSLPAPYRLGERLTFNVSFSNFISAAHVELLVAARGTFFGRDGIQLKGHIETTGVVNAALYAINNDYVTYIDAANGLPFRGQQVIRAASRSSDTSADFNQPAGTAALAQKTTEFPGTYDFLSAVYRLRALRLSEGETYYLTVRGENENYQVEVKVTGRQVIKTNVGSFNTIVSQVHVRNNSQASGYGTKVYFTDDERHVPVLITARVSAGEIRAELAGSEFIGPPAVRPTPGATPVPAMPPNRSPVAIPAQPGGSDGTPLEDLPFKVGEQLNYQVFLPSIGTPVAMASFQVRAHSKYFEHDGLLFTLSAQTTNALQTLFVANDSMSSYADPKTLLPFHTEFSFTEGRRHSSSKLVINQDYGTATPDRGTRIEIPVGTHDYLSFFYALRTFNIRPPRRNAISILVNNKPKTLFISALKRETVQLGSQSIPAIQVSLTTDDAQSDKFQLRAWISDDKRRLPLRLTAVTQLGAVRADLAIIPLTNQ
ncbi:MAG: DUF3108 domain-containing protein, partial [Acidobacteriota bacterium]|nr:DUF3108 domain-containing protein [Acidobacteriota bacterium]